MKLYLGSRDYRPEGYSTVDIDPARNPDILADVTRLSAIASGTVEEICASHILEHLPWPLSFKALAEWARVLRIGGQLRLAVPDLGLLAGLIQAGRNVWGATGLLFGVGRLETQLEAHQYAFTRDMLLEMLRALGFGKFDWWHHDLADASTGWMADDAGDRIGISLNLAGEKIGRPLVDPEDLFQHLLKDRLQPFGKVLMQLVETSVDALPRTAENDPVFVQRLHMRLIEARKRIIYLEEIIRAQSTVDE